MRLQRDFSMVGVTGFEPATSSSRTKRATKLRYTPLRGANEGTRTPDLLITNQLRYQLCHVGILLFGLLSQAHLKCTKRILSYSRPVVNEFAGKNL